MPCHRRVERKRRDDPWFTNMTSLESRSGTVDGGNPAGGNPAPVDR